MRPRILLHSMTFKRDFGMMYVLSKLLESLGCDCIIANNTNLNLSCLRWWRPHAVFFVTLSHAKTISEAYPNAKLFHLSAEGGAFYAPAECSILEDEKTIDNIHQFYLWGKGTYDLISKKEHSLKKQPKTKITDKCMIVGSPRMDLCTFADKSRKNVADKKIKIGLVGSFFYLNNIKQNPLETLGIHELGDFPDQTGDHLRFQIKLCETYCKLIRHLDKNVYSFSIRPYPLEIIKSYIGFEPFAEINTNLEFTSWLTEQDIIIGSTSTTVTQIAATELPYINLDAFLERKEWPYGNFLSSGLENHQAKRFDEILSMIKNHQDFKFKNPKMTEMIDYYYRSPEKGSALYRVAKDIVEKVKCSPLYKSYLPKSIVLKCMDTWAAYIEKRSTEELATDYSYFLFSRVVRQAGLELDGVVDKIISSKGKDMDLSSNA